jgi:hypothetical protein
MEPSSETTYPAGLKDLNLDPPDAADGATAELLVNFLEPALEAGIVEVPRKHHQYIFRRWD